MWRFPHPVEVLATLRRRTVRNRKPASPRHCAPSSGGIRATDIFSAPNSRQRRAVREEVRARLAEFESDGRLKMSVEMLIAAGCA
jgi:hypothetical protein